MQTAAGLPANGRLVKASTCVIRRSMMIKSSGVRCRVSGVRSALECAQGSLNGVRTTDADIRLSRMTVARTRVVSYRDLIVWQRVMELIVFASVVVISFSRYERF